MREVTGVSDDVLEMILSNRLRRSVPKYRDDTAKAAATLRTHLYEPCPCGSGKKFKFCCKE